MDSASSDISDNHSTSSLQPIGYTYRFTFSNQDKELTCLNDKAFTRRCHLMHRALINHMYKNGYFYMGKYTSGFEILNKLGEHCKAHIHIHFKSNNIKESMNRTIKRYLVDEWEQQYLGNSTYSFKPKHVRCDDEFYQYPLKQTLDYNVCAGFTRDQLDFMHEVAKTSYAKVCQVAQAKEDKRDKDDSLFLRVLAICKKKNDYSKRAICLTFIQYYREEKKPINRTVIDGYVLLAMLEMNLITEDDLLDKWGY